MIFHTIFLNRGRTKHKTSNTNTGNLDLRKQVPVLEEEWTIDPALIDISIYPSRIYETINNWACPLSVLPIPMCNPIHKQIIFGQISLTLWSSYIHPPTTYTLLYILCSIALFTHFMWLMGDLFGVHSDHGLMRHCLVSLCSRMLFFGRSLLVQRLYKTARELLQNHNNCSISRNNNFQDKKLEFDSAGTFIKLFSSWGINCSTVSTWQRLWWAKALQLNNVCCEQNSI